MAFQLVPSIVLRQGRAVQLEAGDERKVLVERPDARLQAEMFAEAGARWVHVVDLDAATGGRAQWSRLPGILGVHGLGVQFGGGVRSMTQVQQLLDLGVDRVTVGTQAIRNPRWLEELARIFPDRIVLALDSRKDALAVAGWREDAGMAPAAFLEATETSGLAGIAFTSIDRDGRQGVDRAAVQSVRDAAPQANLLVGGGVSSIEELDWLAGRGIDGAILGAAGYDGRIELAKAFQRFPQERRRGVGAPLAISAGDQDGDAGPDEGAGEDE